MNGEPLLAEMAALIGDPARANMLLALMDGRALTATELSQVAGVTPQTATSHLGKLCEGNLLTVEKQGRHRYFRLAGPAVAAALEALMALTPTAPHRHRPPGPRDGAMRYARSCYDHLAGRLGVAVTERLLTLGWLAEAGGDFALTDAGRGALPALGVDPHALARTRRPAVRRCLDWSERRAHLGGAAGAALLAAFEREGWLLRVRDGRALTLTDAGRDGLRTRLGVDLPTP